MRPPQRKSRTARPSSQYMYWTYASKVASAPMSGSGTCISFFSVTSMPPEGWFSAWKAVMAFGAQPTSAMEPRRFSLPPSSAAVSPEYALSALMT